MTNPYAPPRAAVQDIVDPNAQFVLADRGTRLGAAMLDGVIFMVMVYVPFVAFTMIGGNMRTTDDDASRTAILAIGGSLAVIGLIAWAWLTISYMRRGQSIAKKCLGIKVVRSDGTPVSLARFFWLRNFVNSLIGVIPFYGIVDVIFILGESRRCLHDKIADTMVIKA
jgi:uncharacterized RDD family membrane protein YckC